MKKEIEPYRLLVVEDNRGDAVLLEQYFKRSLLPIEEILFATRMSEVPAIINNSIPDIVLLDLTLPDSKGVDSVLTLTKLLPKTPIVVFSGLSTMEIAIESIALGAQDYLVKGEFDEKMLTKSVQYSIERKKSTEKLRESNERYEFVNKATQDTIWEWDYATNVGKWGEGIIQIFGYTKDKIKYDESWLDEYVHPYDKEEVTRRIQTCIESGIELWQDEFRFRCADGSYKNVYDRGFILFDEEGNPYRMYGAMSDVTEQKQVEKELAEYLVRQQKIITETTIQAQEVERNLLGRELHDNINQILATVKMYLGLIVSGKDKSKELVEKSYEYVNNAMEEIRQLSHSLVAPSLGDIGLEEALEEMVQDSNLFSKMKVHLSVNKNYKKEGTGKNKALMIYRIVQEQLNNIIKYAKAEEVLITLKSEGNNLYLSVEDNGVGFDTTQKSKGIGLKNINNRVDFYAGTMHIISSPGHGCKLVVLIPY